MNRYPARAALILFLAALLSGCGREKPPVVSLGTIERDRVEITADRSEVIAGLFAVEGDHVETGQILCRLDTAVAQVSLLQAEASVAEAEAALAEMNRGTREERLREARARLVSAEAAHLKAQQDNVRVRRLHAEGVLSTSDRDAAVAAEEIAREAKNAARADLDALQTGATPEERAVLLARRERALAARSASVLSLERLTLASPAEGVVESRHFEEGERVEPRVPILVILTGAPFARVHVPEELRARLRPGLAAELTVDGRPETMRGVVRNAARDASFTPYYALTERDRGRLSYLVEVDIIGAEGEELPAGLPVEVRFPGTGFAANGK